MDITYKIEDFEGPIDLLYFLIKKNKIDIFDIPINLITNEYLEHIKYINLDLEYMSDFIVLASTLIEIKSKMLLPITLDDEEYIDPREEIVEQLIEYQRAKLFANNLKDKLYYSSLSKNEEKELLVLFEDRVTPIENILKNITLKMLFDINQQVLDEKNEESNLTQNLKRDIHTIDNKRKYVLNLLELYDNITFYDVITDKSNIKEIVTGFLTILEMLKYNEIQVIQQEKFNVIYITK